jgi:osmotically-inducible protein OsmY
MANRYGRDIGRRDREGFGNEERDRSHYPSASRGYGYSPFEDESYFGGSRRYGEGYSGESPRDFDTGGGDDRRISDYPDRGYSAGRGSSSYDDDRYSQGSERSQGWGRGSRQGHYGGGGSYSDEDRGGSYSSGNSGDYGSGSGYSRGGGYSGYSEREGGGSRGFSGYSSGGGGYSGSYGGGYTGQGSRGHGGDYPSSERGYRGGGYEEDRGSERGWWDRTADEVASWFGDEDATRRRRRDMRESGGGHRGRGPSGYTRSDDRIREDINDRLTDYDYIDATNINVEVTGGEVVLTGTVESRYEKRLAEDIAEDCSGVRNVENRLRISQSGTSYGQGTSAEATGSLGISGTASTPGSINRPATETTTSSTSTTASGGTSTQAKGKSSSGS